MSIFIYGSYMSELIALARALESRRLSPQYIVPSKISARVLRDLGIEGPLQIVPPGYVSRLVIHKGNEEVGAFIAITNHRAQKSNSAATGLILEEAFQTFCVMSGAPSPRGEGDLHLYIDDIKATAASLLEGVSAADLASMKRFERVWFNHREKYELKGKEDDDDVDDDEEEDEGEDEGEWRPEDDDC